MLATPRSICPLNTDGLRLTPHRCRCPSAIDSIRSLLALSLVLSLLLFKPAPMYILDEVDAALDLSHTQNIGAMIKNHFKHSQFIVVSLKEGMFQNANVLFRTKFVDGGAQASLRHDNTALSPRPPALAV